MDHYTIKANSPEIVSAPLLLIRPISLILYLSLLIIMGTSLHSCDYGCIYRTGDAALTIISPSSDTDSVSTSNEGFLEVEGLSFAVHEQICPNGNEIHGEVFILVEAPPATPIFIQDHAYPAADGRWSINIHLGQTKPESGEEFILVAIAVPNELVPTVEKLDTISTIADLKNMGIDVAESEAVRVVIK